MQDMLIRGCYIPLDKSWHIRMAVLDMLHGYDDSIKFFEKFKAEHPNRLSSDLEDTLQASLNWTGNAPIRLESGTLYRNLWYASEKLGRGKVFERQRTLIGRDMGDIPEILEMTLEELALLETSQWASAYVLFNYAMNGKIETVQTDKFKLNVTFEAVRQWTARVHGTELKPQYDGTIFAQARAYLKWINTGEMDFVPVQPEDYCFAMAWDLMTPKEALRMWPSLLKHESNRIDEMENQMNRDVVTSNDHRVVQAIALRRWDDFMSGKLIIEHPECVKKSWPEFGNFIGDAKILPYNELSI